MYIMNLLMLSLPVLIISFFFYKFPPSSISTFYGYRTKRSTSSEEMWIEGNKYASKLMFKLSIVQFILSIVLIIIVKINIDFEYIAFTLLFCTLIIGLIFAIVKTEIHLKSLE